ncbi:MAG: glucose-6-phosphate isomerase, partial [Bifidobacteriaceae bacterium]|nr:glucose-6-phosphate isomerase [Bifidobacteriaceae bacterium]
MQNNNQNKLSENKISDITQTEQWHDLQKHYLEFSKDFSLKKAFAEDPKRADELAFQAGPLYIDFSKNLIDQTTIKYLLNLAKKANLKSKIHSQFFGDHINVTEDRAVLHTALRRLDTDILEVDGQ